MEQEVYWWWNGDNNGTTNVIQYVTISTLGNASDFGDLTQDILSRMLHQMQFVDYLQGGIMVVIIQKWIYYDCTLGNAIDFGNLTQNNKWWNSIFINKT